MMKRYFDEYDSEQDIDYMPTDRQKKEYLHEHHKKQRGKRQPITNAHELYLEMRKQLEHQEQCRQQQKREQRECKDKVALAQQILNSESIKPSKRIIFAGKEYILNEETGQLDPVERKVNFEKTCKGNEAVDQAQVEIRNRHVSYQYLNHIMQAIYYRSKKINAIGKSKLDWKGFVKQEGIEDKLNYNRKSGAINNMQFINSTL